MLALGGFLSDYPKMNHHNFSPIVCCIKYNNNKLLLFSYELKTTILMKDIESIKYLYKEEIDKGSNTERIDT